MPESNRPVLERVARVLAGAKLSANAEGDNGHAAAEVDRTWREHLNQAQAVLHTMREPDETMAAAGDVSVWRSMVEAAISQKVA
jgi:predicted metal-dependent peptidase